MEALNWRTASPLAFASPTLPDRRVPKQAGYAAGDSVFVRGTSGKIASRIVAVIPPGCVPEWELLRLMPVCESGCPHERQFSYVLKVLSPKARGPRYIWRAESAIRRADAEPQKALPPVPVIEGERLGRADAGIGVRVKWVDKPARVIRSGRIVEVIHANRRSRLMPDKEPREGKTIVVKADFSGTLRHGEPRNFYKSEAAR